MLDPNTAIAPGAETAIEGEVFALAPCVLDGASESEGLLCLMLSDGGAVRIPVAREKVGPVARALMGRPAVILLAREGVVVTATLPAGTAALPDARTYADGIDAAARAVTKVALEYGHDTVLRSVLDRAEGAVRALRGEAPSEVDTIAQANADCATLHTRLAATEEKLAAKSGELRDATRVLGLIASVASDATEGRRYPGNKPPEESAFPGHWCFMAVSHVHELAMELRKVRASVDAAAAAQKPATASDLRGSLAATEAVLDATKADLASLTRAVLAAAEGRSIDADVVTLERRPAALALQNVSKVMREAAVGADRWARETRSLSEERNGLRRAMQMLDTVLRADGAYCEITSNDMPSTDEVPDTMARAVIAMARAVARRQAAPAVEFVAACHAQSVHATERAAALEESADRIRLMFEYLRDAVHDIADNARHPTTPAGMFDDRTVAALRTLANRVEAPVVTVCAPPGGAPVAPDPGEWVRWEDVITAAARVAKGFHEEALTRGGLDKTKVHHASGGAWSVHTELATLRHKASTAAPEAA